MSFHDDDLDTQTRWEVWEAEDERRQRINSAQRRLRPPDPRMNMWLQAVSPDFSTIDEDDQIVASVIALHLAFRFRQRRHAPLEEIDKRRDCIFLTVSWVQFLLRRLGYRKTGRDFARTVINRAQELGFIQDTGDTRKPRRPRQSIARAGKFQSAGDVRTEGGADSQPSIDRSRWWRVFRVPALTRVLTSYTPYPSREPDAGSWRGVPRHAVSLCRLLIRQGLLKQPRPRKRFRPGSVQAAFWATGPP